MAGLAVCGRFTLRSPTETIASLFEGLRVPPLEPRFNIAPTQPVACIRSLKGQPYLSHLRWGLVPSWAQDVGVGGQLINARAETVASKPSFGESLKRRRCLVIADGFYEWKKIGRKKFPFYVTRPDSKPFCMAGLWDHWKQGEPSVETCAIITTVANGAMQSLHDRMPVILEPSDYLAWIDSGSGGAETLQRRLANNVEEELRIQEVSRFVNKVGNDTPACIEPECTLFD